jgi:uncharacterized membrane protein
MRLFLTILLGGALSFALALGVVLIATEWLPCHEDQMSCGMGQAYSILAIIVYAPLVMIVFGVTMWLAPSERGLAVAAIALLAPVVGFLAFGMILNGLPRDFLHELVRQLNGLLAFYVPPLLIVGVQWAALRAYMRRKVPV